MFNGKYLLHMCNSSGVQELPHILQQSLNVIQYGLQKRYFLDIHSRKKAYHDRKLVGYSSEQMFDVVADVEHYKDFLPFCKKSFILTKKEDFIRASLEIGFPPIIEGYTSKVKLIRPNFIRAVCTDGKLFNHLITIWKFNPGLKSNPYSCIVDFSVDFEFKSLLHSNLARMFFDALVKQMEGAFLVEAKRRYGRESLPSHPLAVRKHNS